MVSIRDDGAGVTVEAESNAGSGKATLRAAYALGADGGSSPTRKSLGISYAGEGSANPGM